MTYNEIYRRNFYVQAMPLQGLRGKGLAEVIMLQVGMAKAVAAFEDKMSEALKKLKEARYPEFDAESQKPEGERKPEYKDWEEALGKEYADMRLAEAGKEAVGAAVPEVTREALAAMCEQGADGDIALPGQKDKDGEDRKMPKAALLLALAEMVED